MSEFLMVGLGGALGTMARYGIWRTLPPQTGAFTWAIFAVNVVGSFLLGLLVGLMIGRLEDRVRLFFFIGMLGGFTTFSTFIVDTIELYRAGVTGGAVANVVLSVGVGLVLATAGLLIGESLNPTL
jgi:CrcB protein